MSTINAARKAIPPTYVPFARFERRRFSYDEILTVLTFKKAHPKTVHVSLFHRLFGWNLHEISDIVEFIQQNNVLLGGKIIQKRQEDYLFLIDYEEETRLTPAVIAQTFNIFEQNLLDDIIQALS